MSWHFSQALEAAYLEENSLDGKLFAPWRSTPFAQGDSCSAKMKGIYHRSLYGTMFVPLMDGLGEALLMWYLEDFLANHSALRLMDMQQQLISGLKCEELYQKSVPPVFSQKTSHSKPSAQRRSTLGISGIKQRQLPYPRKTWVQTTFGNDIG